MVAEAADELASELDEIEFLKRMALGQYNAMARPLQKMSNSWDNASELQPPVAQLAARLEGLEALRHAVVRHYSIGAHAWPRTAVYSCGVEQAPSEALATRLNELEELALIATKDCAFANNVGSSSGTDLEDVAANDATPSSAADAEHADDRTAQTGELDDRQHSTEGEKERRESSASIGEADLFDPDSVISVRTFQVRVPADAVKGDRLLVTTPNRRKMQITVPKQSLGPLRSIAVPYIDHGVVSLRRDSETSVSVHSDAEFELGLQTFELKLPADAVEGEQLLVTTPDGVQMQVTVPAGVAPGGDNRMAVPYIEHSMVLTGLAKEQSRPPGLQARLDELERLKRAAVEDYTAATRFSWEAVSGLHQAPAEALAARLDELEALTQQTLHEYAAATRRSVDGVQPVTLPAQTVEAEEQTLEQTLANEVREESHEQEEQGEAQQRLRRDSTASIDEDFFDSECEISVRTFQVQVPEGAMMGDRLLVTTPDRRQMQVTVPMLQMQRTHFTVPYVYHGENLDWPEISGEGEPMQARIDRLAILSSHDRDGTW